MLKIKFFSFTTILLFSSFTIFAQLDNWKQYNSSTLGFKLNYPSEWTSEEKTYGQVWQIYFKPPGKRTRDQLIVSTIKICSQPKGYDSSFSDDRTKCNQYDNIFGRSDNKVISEEVVDVSGLKIRKKIAEDSISPTTYIYAFFSIKNRDFIVSSVFKRQFGLDKYIPDFDQMLSTLQLLEKDTTLTFKNEQYGFSIKYPASWRSCPITPYYAKEKILILVPESEGCIGANSIFIGKVPELSDARQTFKPKEFLEKQNYSKIVSDVEFGNIKAVSGEKSEDIYFFRQSYFYTNKPGIYSLLKVFETYEKTEEKYRQEAAEILATVRVSP